MSSGRLVSAVKNIALFALCLFRLYHKAPKNVDFPDSGRPAIKQFSFFIINDDLTNL